MSPRARGWVRVAIVVATVACAWLTAVKLRVSGDLSALFPREGDALALVRWTRAFRGSDPVVVLVRGDEPRDVADAAEKIAASLRGAKSIVRVLDRTPEPATPGDPTLAWAFAGPEARARLAAIVTSPDAMRERLAGTRELLLAPAGAADAEEWLARDPLRLGLVPWEAARGERAEIVAGVGALPGEPFVADGGKARLVLAEPRGSAFESASARAVAEDVERAVAAAPPGVKVEVAGGHAIAWATELMLRRDLELSGGLSALLASVAFVVTFRRVRALVAVLPPLALGTLWTTGIAALLPAGLNAVAIAFAAVVVGVGVDTGVHVYAALLAARRAGLSPSLAAARARATTARPTLTAAVVAGAAFASLALSRLGAMKQLGLLCAAGEVLTAIAILIVTPEIGAWLERKPPPVARTPRWVDALASATATRGRAAIAIALCALPVALLAVVGWPRPAGALVAVHPHDMAPLVAEDHVRAIFGGRGGQWIILSADREEGAARARSDRIAEALEPLVPAGVIDGYDALGTFAPSAATQRERLAERDALDLPSRRGAFEEALRSAGFDVDACAPALDAFAHPSHELIAAGATDADDARSWLYARHVASDEGEALVATYVRPTGDVRGDARARDAILRADPAAAITGLDAIDRALRAALGRDLVLVGAVALVVVAIAMRLALRNLRLALVALATLACEMGVVGLAMRALSVQWHVYDALVVPVLFGVTIDESMFLLDAARAGDREGALREQAPLVAATALTTAAGFAALIGCRFPGLRDLGTVGVIGVIAGLVAALVVVPSALRLLGGEASSRRPTDS
jgi:predicted RND superfamily exporter protein